MGKGDPRAHAQMRYLRGWAAGGVRVNNYRVCQPGRSIIQWTPITKLASIPAPLLPAQGDPPPEILELIPVPRRWNSLYEQVKGNSSLDKETLRFQARFLRRFFVRSR